MPGNCFSDCKDCLVVNPHQPPNDLEWITEDNVFLKLMILSEAGMIVPQHSHTYDHTSLLLQGSVEILIDGVSRGVYKAPAPLSIQAGIKHSFVSLEPDTRVLCVHRLEFHETYPSIQEEHNLVGLKCK